MAVIREEVLNNLNRQQALDKLNNSLPQKEEEVVFPIIKSIAPEVVPVEQKQSFTNLLWNGIKDFTNKQIEIEGNILKDVVEHVVDSNKIPNSKRNTPFEKAKDTYSSIIEQAKNPLITINKELSDEQPIQVDPRFSPNLDANRQQAKILEQKKVEDKFIKSMRNVETILAQPADFDAMGLKINPEQNTIEQFNSEVPVTNLQSHVENVEKIKNYFQNQLNIHKEIAHGQQSPLEEAYRAELDNKIKDLNVYQDALKYQIALKTQSRNKQDENGLPILPKEEELTVETLPKASEILKAKSDYYNKLSSVPEDEIFNSLYKDANNIQNSDNQAKRDIQNIKKQAEGYSSSKFIPGVGIGWNSKIDNSKYEEQQYAFQGAVNELRGVNEDLEKSNAQLQSINNVVKQHDDAINKAAKEGKEINFSDVDKENYINTLQYKKSLEENISSLSTWKKKVGDVIDKKLPDFKQYTIDNQYTENLLKETGALGSIAYAAGYSVEGLLRNAYEVPTILSENAFAIDSKSDIFKSTINKPEDVLVPSITHKDYTTGEISQTPITTVSSVQLFDNDGKWHPDFDINGLVFQTTKTGIESAVMMLGSELAPEALFSKTFGAGLKAEAIAGESLAQTATEELISNRIASRGAQELGKPYVWSSAENTLNQVISKGEKAVMASEAKQAVAKVGDYVLHTTTGFVAPSVLFYGGDMIKAEMDKGLSLDDAIKVGTLRASIEGLTEQMFVDNFLAVKGLLGKGSIKTLEELGENKLYNSAVNEFLDRAVLNPKYNEFFKKAIFNFDKQKAKESFKEFSKILAGESIEEVLGNALNVPVTTLAKKYNENYKNNEEFSLENNLNTVVQTMATMIPQALVGGAHSYRGRTENQKTSQFYVGQAPEIYKQTVYNLLQNGKINSIEAQRRVQLINEYSKVHEQLAPQYQVLDEKASERSTELLQNVLKSNQELSPEILQEIQNITQQETQNKKYELFSNNINNSLIDKELTKALSEEKQEEILKELDSIAIKNSEILSDNKSPNNIKRVESAISDLVETKNTDKLKTSSEIQQYINQLALVKTRGIIHGISKESVEDINNTISKLQEKKKILDEKDEEIENFQNNIISNTSSKNQYDIDVLVKKQGNLSTDELKYLNSSPEIRQAFDEKNKEIYNNNRNINIAAKEINNVPLTEEEQIHKEEHAPVIEQKKQEISESNKKHIEHLAYKKASGIKLSNEEQALAEKHKEIFNQALNKERLKPSKNKKELEQESKQENEEIPITISVDNAPAIETDEPTIEEKNEAVEEQNTSEKEINENLSDKQTLEVDGKTKLISPANTIAYLAREYNETEEYVFSSTNELNPNFLINHTDAIKPGVKVFLKSILDTNTDRFIQQAKDEFKEAKLAGNEHLNEDDLDNDALFSPIGIYIEGRTQPVGMYHVISYIRTDRVVATLKDVDGNEIDNLQVQYDNLKTLRNKLAQYFKENETLETSIDATDLGHLSIEKDKSFSPLKDAFKNDGVLSSLQIVEKSDLTDNKGRLVLGKPSIGNLVVLLPTNLLNTATRENFKFAANLKRNKIGEDKTKTLISAIKIFLNQDTNAADKLLDKYNLSSEYDVSTKDGINKFFSLFAYSTNGDKFKEDTELSVSLTKIPYINFNLYKSEEGKWIANIEYSENRIPKRASTNELERNVQGFPMSVSNIKLHNEDGSLNEKALDGPSGRYLQEFIANLPINVSNTNLKEDEKEFSFPDFSYNGGKIAFNNSKEYNNYKDFITNEIQTNILEHKIEDKFVYFEQPNISILLNNESFKKEETIKQIEEILEPSELETKEYNLKEEIAKQEDHLSKLQSTVDVYEANSEDWNKTVANYNIEETNLKDLQNQLQEVEKELLNINQEIVVNNSQEIINSQNISLTSQVSNQKEEVKPGCSSPI